MRLDLQDTTIGSFNYELLRGMSIQGSNGAEPGECVATTARIHENDVESWTLEWLRTADAVAEGAEQALQQGYSVSARDAFLRAATYYRMAELFVVQEDQRHVHAWKRARACFQQALPLLATAVEILEIPFEDTYLPGYFISGGTGKRPVLIAMGGIDGSGEELYHWIGRAVAERGWHCLIFEGPGQHGVLHLNAGLYLRPDYEVPVRAVVDYALTRVDVDSEKLALIGYSLGGYLATRAAIFEPRIKACVANSLLVDLSAAWLSAWPATLLALPKEVFDVAFMGYSRMRASVYWGYNYARRALNVKLPHEIFAAWEPYTLHGLEKSLHTPLLCLFGEDELAVAAPQMVGTTLRFINALGNKRRLHFFTKDEGAGSHCQMGGLAKAQAVICDWLAEIFSQDAAPHVYYTATSNMSLKQWTDVLEKYHGKVALKNMPYLSNSWRI